SVLGVGDRGRAGPPPGCLSWQPAPDGCAVAGARDYFRDARPRHDVTSIVLLRSDGDRATVLADVVRRDGRHAPARLCGPVQLRREEAGWRVTGPAALRAIGRDARCLP